MKGPWFGKYTGSNEGEIIVNVDDCITHFEGVANLNEKNKAFPSNLVVFKTKNKEKEFLFRTEMIEPINPSTDWVDSWNNIKSFYADNIIIPNYADVIGSWDNETLILNWKTDISGYGSCSLPCSRASQPSELTSTNLEWKDYKKHVSKWLEGKRYLFRGQNEPWRLRTSFHRTKRADVGRFVREDIPILYKHLSARTKHIFNLKDPDENGAFFNLVQHHGYPTPLLDWTYSPYVAAFFAYRGISNNDADNAKPEKKVRILVFDQAQWRNDFNQLNMLVTSTFHLSIGEFIAIENERMIPQQASSLVTNIDDIESYVMSKETETKKYIWAIDLPMNEKRTVTKELGYMGITAGSLFPGFDGACEELREKNFDI